MADGGELAAFLRSRREKLKPEQVGLSSSGRRRTPGLRREELATLAGLSVEYLERLEQGRDTNPSVAVLAALAEALRLSDDDKRHLAMSAMKRHTAALFPEPRPISDESRSTVRALLDHLDPTPACLLGPIYNVAA
ncbi:helix-turn-helix domain-containing protein [Streptomyces sp. NPDC055722]